MPEINYFWDEIEDNVVREYDENNNTVASYTTEPTLYGSVLSQDRGGVKRHFHYDGQGNAMELTGDAGNVTDTRRYSAFGQTRTSLGTTTFPSHFGGRHGYYSDHEIGRYYVRRRWLNQSLGRWLSPDPLTFIDDINLFAFGNANPIMAVDPSGLKVCHILVLGGHGAFLNPDGTVREIGGWVQVKVKEWVKDEKLQCDVIGVGLVCCFSTQICKEYNLPVLPGIPLSNKLVFVTRAQMLDAINKALDASKLPCNKKVCDHEVCDRISVHIKCDPHMEVVLGKMDVKKYCNKHFVYDCKKEKWEK